MKKIFTLIAAGMCGLAAMATTYTGQLTVTINGQSSTENEVSINVDQNGDLYTLSLENFVLGGQMAIGNIVIPELQAIDANGVKVLTTNQNITIAEGTDTSVPTWVGPGLGEIPVQMTSAFNDQHIVAYIDINFEQLGQVIAVKFDNTLDDFQIGNNGFEIWAEAASGYKPEPMFWHSFQTATGNFAAMAGDHIFQSQVTRPGSDGQYSAVLTSTKVIGIVANGTMTTGRLNAGNATAANTANHSYLDMSATDVDHFQNPYYVTLQARPDALKTWVRFYQQEFQAAHPYATVNAVITDGTRYQDPEDQAYTNVVAKATNRTIAINNSQWQEITVPFDYDTYAANNAEAKALLVTFSTNADAGQGSCKVEGGLWGIGGTITDADSLFVDDISLVYNAGVTDLRFQGQTLEGFDPETKQYNITLNAPQAAPARAAAVSTDDFAVDTDGQSAYVGARVDTADNGYLANVAAVSADLQNINVYTININEPTTAVSDINAGKTIAATAYYNLAGVRVSQPQQGINIVVTRYTDGTQKAEKVVF